MPSHRGSDWITAATVVRYILAVEGSSSGQHLVDDDAEGPDVGALVDELATRLLGRHVCRGAEDQARLRGDGMVGECVSCSTSLPAGSDAP